MRRILPYLATFLYFAGSAQALIPTTLNYQGRIKLNSSGTPVADSSGNTVMFVIYNAASGGTNLWSETWNNATSCVTTTSGLFNVVLGSWTPLTLPFDQQYYLEISWSNGGSMETMAPRQPLTASPYSYKSKNVEGPVSVTSTGSTALFGANTSGFGILGVGQTGTAGGIGVLAGDGGQPGALGLQVNGSSLFGASGTHTFAPGSTVNFTGATVNGLPGVSAPFSLTLNAAANAPLSLSNATGTAMLAAGGAMGLSVTAGGAGAYGVYASVGSSNSAVYAANTGSGPGLSGISASGTGVSGNSTGGFGVYGSSNTLYGVYGSSAANTGIYGTSPSGDGVYGTSTSGVGVGGFCINCDGVDGASTNDYGVRGLSTSNDGVYGSSTNGTGIYGLGQGTGGIGVSGIDTLGVGVTAQGVTATVATGSSLGLSATASNAQGTAVYAAAGSGAPAAIFNNAGGGPALSANGVSLGLSVTATSAFGIAMLVSATTSFPAVEIFNNGTGSPLKINSMAFPQNDGGINGNVLTTNGVGTLSFQAPAGAAAPLDLSNAASSASVIYADNIFGGIGIYGKDSNGGSAAVVADGAGLGISATASAPTGVAGFFQGVSALVAAGTALGISASTSSMSGYALQAINSLGAGILGVSTSGGGWNPGVLGLASGTGMGVDGKNPSTGAEGTLGNSTQGHPAGNVGVQGIGGGVSPGVDGESGLGIGVRGLGVTGVAGLVTAPGQIGLSGDTQGNAASLALHTFGNAVFDLSAGGPNSVTFNTAVIFNGPVTGISVSAPLSLPLNSVANSALSASNPSGNAMLAQGVTGVTASGSYLGLSVTATGPLGIGIYAASNSSNDTATFYNTGTGRALYAQGSGAVAIQGTGSGVTDGVWGTTGNGLAKGVYGINTSAFGNAWGVYGTSSSVAGYGVYGVDSNANGGTGVFAQGVTASVAVGTSMGLSATASDPAGYGVYAWTNSSNASMYGVNAGTGNGVRGDSSSFGNGVYGSNSANGNGVEGQNTSNGFGVYGINSANGSGVYGLNSSTGYAVKGQNTGTGTAIYALSAASTGVYAQGVTASVAVGTTMGLSVTANAASGQAIYASTSSTSPTVQITNNGAGSPLKINSMTFPPNDSGTAGNVLTTNGSGSLSFAPASGLVTAPLSLSFNASSAPLYAFTSGGGSAISASGNGAGTAGATVYVDNTFFVPTAIGLYSLAGGTGVLGNGTIDYGVEGSSGGLAGVFGAEFGAGPGVYGANYFSTAGQTFGVLGLSVSSTAGVGVGGSGTLIGVSGSASALNGMGGYFIGVTGVAAVGSAYGIYAQNPTLSGPGLAAVGLVGVSSTGQNTAGSTSYGIQSFGYSNTASPGADAYGVFSNATHLGPSPGNAFGLFSTASTSLGSSYGLVASAATFGVSATATGAGGVGVLAQGVTGVAAVGTAVGISATVSANSNGYGVYGQNVLASNGGAGIYGYNTSFAGYGVEGVNGSAGLFATGVFGSSASNSGIGVEGSNQVVTNTGYGVEGLNLGSSINSVGVFGDASSGTGMLAQGAFIGISANASGATGIGVYGQGVTGVVATGTALGISATSANGYALSAYSAGSNAIYATSNSTDGIYGTTNVAAHAGISGGNNAGGVGVYGQGNPAVEGYANAGGTAVEAWGNSNPYGVSASASTSGGVGVLGADTNAGAFSTGVLGLGGPAGQGVLGQIAGSNATVDGRAGVQAQNLATSAGGGSVAIALDVDGGISMHTSRSDPPAGAVSVTITGGGTVTFKSTTAVTIVNSQIRAGSMLTQSLIFCSPTGTDAPIGTVVSVQALTVTAGSASCELELYSSAGNMGVANTYIATFNYLVINQH